MVLVVEMTFLQLLCIFLVSPQLILIAPFLVVSVLKENVDISVTTHICREVTDPLCVPRLALVVEPMRFEQKH